MLLRSDSRVEQWVIGNINDPATRYQHAVSTSRIMPTSRLLTLDGSGHTSLFLSSCVDRHVNRYLLTGEEPAAGTICGDDVVPFSGPARRSVAALATPFLLPPTLLGPH